MSDLEKLDQDFRAAVARVAVRQRHVENVLANDAMVDDMSEELFAHYIAQRDMIALVSIEFRELAERLAALARENPDNS